MANPPKKRKKRCWRLVHPERLLLAVLLLLFLIGGTVTLVHSCTHRPAPEESVAPVREEESEVSQDSRKGTVSLEELAVQLQATVLATMDVNRENYYRAPELPPKEARLSVGYRYCLVLAAGHGGEDPGSVAGEIYEKDINLAVALAVREYIEHHASDIKVVMTRTGDTLVNYQEQVAVAEHEDADLLLILHTNSYSGTGRAIGTQGFYQTVRASKEMQAKNKALAEALTGAISEALETYNRGVSNKTADGLLDLNDHIPLSLVELGFITDEEEVAKLTSPVYQEKMGEAIGKVLIDTLDSYPVRTEEEEEP